MQSGKLTVSTITKFVPRFIRMMKVIDGKLVLVMQNPVQESYEIMALDEKFQVTLVSNSYREIRDVTDAGNTIIVSGLTKQNKYVVDLYRGSDYACVEIEQDLILKSAHLIGRDIYIYHSDGVIRFDGKTMAKMNISLPIEKCYRKNDIIYAQFGNNVVKIIGNNVQCVTCPNYGISYEDPVVCQSNYCDVINNSDAGVCVWRSGKLIKLVKNTAIVCGTCLLSDDSVIACDKSNNTVCISPPSDIGNVAPKYTLRHNGPVKAIFQSHNVMCFVEEKERVMIWHWDPSTYKLIRRVRYSGERPPCKFIKFAEYLIAYSYNEGIYVLDC